MYTINSLYDYAHEFRGFLEKFSKKTKLITLKDFPRGSCGDASLLLSMFLSDNNIGNVYYVCGWCDKKSHAWLEVDRFVVDITMDQFGDNYPSVIVNEDYSFHYVFDIELKRLINIDMYDAKSRNQLLSAYNVLISSRNDV